MPPDISPRQAPDYVEAFGTARAQGPADPSDFAPPPDHPLRLSVLRDLVRIDLEAAWSAGTPKPLDDYRDVFPDLFADPAAAADLALTEYRLLLRAGFRPSPEDYAQR